jgi:hypothetical protein
MTKIKSLVIFAFLFLPWCSSAASLSVSPPQGVYKVGDTFNVSIFTNPEGGSFDTVRAKINFSQDVLEVQKFSLSSSFTHQSGGNTLGTESGQFSWGAGVAGGTSESTVFGTISFKAKKPGEATISVNSDSLVLSDGENTFDGKQVLAVYDVVTAPSPAPVQKQPKPVEKTQPAPVQPSQNEGDTQIPAPIPDSSQESIFPNQTADLSNEVLPVFDSEPQKEPLFSRTNKIILAIMFLALLFIGWAIYRLRRRELKIR